MRRADRLFEIIQLLRGRSTTTAAELARELEVSERTIYRDIQDLMASGVPIEGEAGVGYALDHFDLPPLVFDRDEIEALVFGMRIVESFGDAELAASARRALRKVEAALPDHRRPYVEGTPLLAHNMRSYPPLKFDLAVLRHAIRDFRYADLDYVDADGAPTRRRVRPLGMAFFGTTWLLMGWCELREDFRSFRPDRIHGLEISSETFVDAPPRDLCTYLTTLRQCSEPDF
ncbi:HTH domain protein [Planctomycetes bacterium Poly30]|uniref:HTH domain protein n=1 Tax=Saltatorellus ferox TaxID=2528018 RepID=A0A518ELC5_9BACT|nr:HTH domain protein [Planctomycetes bacterium Poly30]